MANLRAQTPWGELLLQLRAGSTPTAALILEGVFLMDSQASASEQALACAGLEELLTRRGLAARGEPSPTSSIRALVGGLGLGITLRELLRQPAVGHVQVVEILAPVVEWNRGPLRFVNGGALDDPRVTCFIGDLRDFLTRPVQEGPSDQTGEANQPPDGGGGQPKYDLLLIDVDNGPTWLSLPSNAWLYTPEGLETLRGWIAPGGMALFWATEPCSRFEEALSSLQWIDWRVEVVPWQETAGGRRFEYFLYLIATTDA